MGLVEYLFIHNMRERERICKMLVQYIVIYVIVGAGVPIGLEREREMGRVKAAGVHQHHQTHHHPNTSHSHSLPPNPSPNSAKFLVYFFPFLYYNSITITLSQFPYINLSFIILYTLFFLLPKCTLPQGTQHALLPFSFPYNQIVYKSQSLITSNTKNSIYLGQKPKSIYTTSPNISCNSIT